MFPTSTTKSRLQQADHDVPISQHIITSNDPKLKYPPSSPEHHTQKQPSQSSAFLSCTRFSPRFNTRAQKPLSLPTLRLLTTSISTQDNDDEELTRSLSCSSPYWGSNCCEKAKVGYTEKQGIENAHQQEVPAFGIQCHPHPHPHPKLMHSKSLINGMPNRRKAHRAQLPNPNTIKHSRHIPIRLLPIPKLATTLLLLFLFNIRHRRRFRRARVP